MWADLFDFGPVAYSMLSTYDVLLSWLFRAVFKCNGEFCIMPILCVRLHLPHWQRDWNSLDEVTTTKYRITFACRWESTFVSFPEHADVCTLGIMLSLVSGFVFVVCRWLVPNFAFWMGATVLGLFDVFALTHYPCRHVAFRQQHQGWRVLSVCLLTARSRATWLCFCTLGVVGLCFGPPLHVVTVLYFPSYFKAPSPSAAKYSIEQFARWSVGAAMS